MAAADQDACTLGARFFSELLGRSGLAEAGTARECHHASPPGEYLFERPPELAEFAAAAHEGSGSGGAWQASRLQAGVRGAFYDLGREAVTTAVDRLNHRVGIRRFAQCLAR